ncbi:MAG: hypothetical protein CMH83_15750 [Nocardioides sp.]|nr:hypothetical protein [Nocardioides sp.]
MVFPFGGLDVVVALVVATGLACAGLGWLLRRRLPFTTAWSVAGLVWSLLVIALVTLVPTSDPGVVSDVGRLETCSFDYGGPAPDGFWILGGTQRLLNTLVFLPSGVLLVLATARWQRFARWAVPLGLLALVGYSVGIEATQLVLARLDRRCDVTDVVDNGLGALIGVGAGVVLALVLRPWRAPRPGGTPARPPVHPH